MHARFALPALCVTLLLAACSTTSDTKAAPTSSDAPASSQPASPIAEPASPWAAAKPLARGGGHGVDIREVWLDPDASAALSLDGLGEVRLWPALAGELAELAPVRLPIDEPATLSFARTGEGSFLIATIDTAQLGRVFEVRADASGEFEVIERMRFAGDDPLFELHVLPGGERIVALGVDHRLRLFDRAGTELDELSEHGFAPWQLRFVGRGESLAAALVLAQPTRVQRLSLAGDRLAVVGEPRRVFNDRGPNLNDLQLTPDGKHVTAFRRPKAKGQAWSLELIDLESGEVRVMKGEVESRIRPRLHLVDGTRALLEDGAGFGHWIDLRGGVVMPPDFVLPEDLDDLPDAAAVVATRVPLAGSIERERWHASVVAGLRAVPEGQAILLDPLDDDTHRRLGHARAHVTDVGFTEDGEQVVWRFDGQAEGLSEPSERGGELATLAVDATGVTWASSATITSVGAGGWVFAALEDPRRVEIRSPEGARVELRLATDDRIEAVLPSPEGGSLAVVQRRRGGFGANWDRLPDSLHLSVYSLAGLPEPPRLVWQLVVDDRDAEFVWSPEGKRLGIAGGSEGGLVISAQGEALVERRHGVLSLQTGSDAEVGGREAEALRERQRIEREF